MDCFTCTKVAVGAAEFQFWCTVEINLESFNITWEEMKKRGRIEAKYKSKTDK